MTREYVVRRGMRTDFGKYRQPTWDLRIGGLGQVKCVVERQKQGEHLSAADDRDGAAIDPEPSRRLSKCGADWIPQQRIWMRGIGRKRRDFTGEDKTLAAGCTRAALVGMAAMHDDRGVVECALEKALIGIVADRRRHFAFAVRDHAVGRNDHITFDALHGCQANFRNSLDN